MAKRTKSVKKKPVKKKNFRQIAFTRFMFIVAFFVLWIGGISARLVHLQVKQHDYLSERAARQRQDVKRSKLPRGTIYDRNGRVLAMSVNVKTLYADATEITDVRRSAKKIAKVLGVNETNLYKQLSAAKEDEKKFVPLAKGLDEEAAQRINKALEDSDIKKATAPKFEGLHWREDQKRSYPNQTLASHVIGFSSAEGAGQAGIEQSQNDVLYGAVIKRTFERDRLGRVYDEVVSEKEPPKDVVLTISAPVQFATEQALEKAAKAANAKAGMAVVIANKTGEVLAMANYPAFDPNKITGNDPEYLKNGVVQNFYSPGSVFKLVTYGAALDKQLITPEGEIDSGNGTIEVAKHRFRDSHAIGRVTYKKAFAHSSNVCAIKTSMKVGREDFYGALQKFGFGKPTGIELPAETGGMVRPPHKWNGDSMASMSIGYEIGVSALQMASAFATIANDGVRVQPHIIKEIRQTNGTVVSAPQAARSEIVSREAAQHLRTMMKEVVLAGTGKRARLESYTSAGKTGTAWKFDPVIKRINPGKYVSSFIGFAPADDPEITIAVVMDEPKSGARDGGGVAAPVFKEIADQILPELNVAQDKENEFPQSPQTGEEMQESLPGDETSPDADIDEQARTDSRNRAALVAKTSQVSAVRRDSAKDPAVTSKVAAATGKPNSQKNGLKNKSSTSIRKAKT